MQNKKGFTLIELLVVIAIIGILSGLIVVSMGGAQNSAKDARIKTSMDQLRTVAALYNNTNSSYGTLTVNGACAGTNFTSAGDGALLLADMATQQATGATCWGATTTLSTFCVLKTLNTGTGTSALWCIDSNGYSGNPGATGCTSAAHYLCNN